MIIVAFVHLVAAELNRGESRPFTCGWCGGTHEARVRTLPPNQVQYVISPSHQPCGLAGTLATSWEAAARIAAAMDAGGHLHQLKRDGAL